jgi:PKD repeat protein
VNGNIVASKMSNTVGGPSAIGKSTDNQVLAFDKAFFNIPGILNNTLPEATIEFWINIPKTLKTEQSIGNYDGFAFKISGTRYVDFGWDKNEGNYFNNSSVALNGARWTHVALVINHNIMTLYVNGTRKGTFTSHTYSGLPAEGDLTFGNIGAPLGSSIDEVRIWKSAHSQRQILYNMKAEIANPSAQSDLLAYYKMDTYEKDGQTLLRDAAHGYYDAPVITLDEGSATASTDNSFLTLKRAPVATFKVEGGPYYPGDAVPLVSDALESTVSWTWNAPDAGAKDLHTQNVNLVFPKAGRFPVTQKVVDIDSVTAEVTDTVVIEEAPTPKADFDIANASLPAGEHFSFLNRSQGGGCTYVWTMPGADQETVKGTNASASYNATGTYDVTLTATNAKGEKASVTKKVNVTEATPLADFDVRSNIVMKGEKVYLIDKSRYQPTEWLWEVSTGNFHSGIVGQNSSFTPLHPGYYDVKLTACNKAGQSTVEHGKAFIVANANSENGLNFAGDGQKMSFDNPFTATTRAFTIDWWMNPSQAEGAFTLTGGSDPTLSLTTDADGAMTLQVKTKTGKSTDAYVIPKEWHHYAVTYNNGKATFYRDGLKISSPSTAYGISALDFSGGFTMGSNTNGMKTAVDELHIWSNQLSEKKIQSYCNQPIENVDSVEKADDLILYYNFNQSGGNAIDQTSGHHDGVRSGFGPDGDAWSSSLGVFTLNFDEANVQQEDVSAKYLTNYKAPFLNNGKEVNPNNENYLGLLTNDEKSTWQLCNTITDSTGIVSGFYVDKTYSYLCVSSGRYYFSDALRNHKAFETVTLPAGIYELTANKGTSSINRNSNIYLIAAYGDSLPDVSNVESAMAKADLSSENTIKFTLLKDTELSLGFVTTLIGYNNMTFKNLELKRTPIEVSNADGLTSIRDAVAAGAEPSVKPIKGGVRIYSNDVERTQIYTVDGKLVFDEMMSGTKRIALPKGLYIVNGVKIAVQ